MLADINHLSIEATVRLCFYNCDCLLYSTVVAMTSYFISSSVIGLGKLLRVVVLTGCIDETTTLAIYETLKQLMHA